MTGDRDTAYSALFERFVESSRVTGLDEARARRGEGGDPAELRRQPRRVCHRARARGSERVDRARRARRRASPRAGAGDARRQLADRGPDPDVLRVVSRPLGSARPVEARRPRGSARRRRALPCRRSRRRASSRCVPARPRRCRRAKARFRIKPLDDALPLGAVPLGKATPAIKAALRGFARGEQFEQWTVGKQRAALNTAICAKDDLPQPSAVDLTSYLPFLRLG